MTALIGASMLMFGILKFVDPFKTWYTTQLSASEMPFPVLSYWAGQLGEISVGIGFLLLVLNHKKWNSGQINRVLSAGTIIIVIMMLTAVYVHLQPNVPAAVLPLKIKPPFIPGFFLFLAILNWFFQKRTLAPGRIEI